PAPAALRAGGGGTALSCPVLPPVVAPPRPARSLGRHPAYLVWIRDPYHGWNSTLGDQRHRRGGRRLLAQQRPAVVVDGVIARVRPPATRLLDAPQVVHAVDEQPERLVVHVAVQLGVSAAHLLDARGLPGILHQLPGLDQLRRCLTPPW